CGAAHYRGPGGSRDLRGRPCASLKDALLQTTSPRLMSDADRAQFCRVEDVAKLSRYGGDCYADCMPPRGHIDPVIGTALKPYDTLPLMPIISGAGGIVTSWEGGAPNSGRVVAAGDLRVHEQALKILAEL